MEQIIYLVSGAALTWAFYFIQRRVERRGTVDAIERTQKLLALKQGLESAHTDLDDLRRFEHRLIDTAETAVRIADTYFTKAEEVARHGEDAASQTDMNTQAIDQFQREDARLAAVVARLRSHLDGSNLDAFEEAHRAWLGFRQHYARFISQSYGDGSIRPLIHAVTLESVTLAWIAELRTQLADID
ncbi:MAG: lysozyme inhibitor LprI family protein [Pseudomonadota bacterium]|nr:lysozyme inhibitor LprI family protein [Pseudomonadota bacterium]